MPRTVIILVDCLRAEGGTPFEDGSEGAFLLKLGSLLAGGTGGRLLLCAVVAVPEGESVSAYSTAAQARRQELEKLAHSSLESGVGVAVAESTSPVLNLAPTAQGSASLIAPVVRVAPGNDIANEVRRFVEGEHGALVLLPMRRMKREECPWLRKALRTPLPCDVAWARMPGAAKSKVNGAGFGLDEGMKILVPARGGPQAELALQLSQDLMDALRAEVTVLHVLQDMPEKARASEEAPFAELLSQIRSRAQGPESHASGAEFGLGALDVGPHEGMTTQRTPDLAHNPAGTISEAAAEYDMLIMGAGPEQTAGVGRFTEQVAKGTTAALLAVKTRIPVGPAIRAARRRARPHVLDPETLSLLVDKWFAENTFHADEFSDLSRLVDIKRKRNVTISLGLPALNEEKTIGPIIETLKTSMMQDVPLLDEMVLIDSSSTDRTREIAAEHGIPVYIHPEVLPEAGEPFAGKGEALWKSLHVLKGDIIAWVDTDVANMHPQFVYGLIGPLLREPRIGYVKGYYHRPIKSGGHLQHEGGGRVTELTVRPLLNLFFPLLSGLVQPLAGEYAGRREVLEQLPFFAGYGVETGLLIDLLEQFGLSSIGQVNLGTRVHRNRSLAELSLTAFAIAQVILTRLEERARIKLLEEVNRSMKLIRFEEDHLSLVVRRVRDPERPPIITIPSYREERASKT
ncbi:MAG: glucosyl-3-phosphoglycerate synthase [Chloroflexia bacterium]